MIDSSSSGFVSPSGFSTEWRDVTLVKRHSHTLVYSAVRYGRIFLLKGLPAQDYELTEFRLRQEKEFQFGIRLVHPNIAATYTIEQVPEIGRCIVQEYVDGVTLGEWLATSPSFSARRRVLEQLLDALEYIHGLQLVHRDLKADNILITRNGANVKLIDFGLSETDDVHLSVGNDVKTDIQAVGKLLAQLLPHRYLFMARRCRKGDYLNVVALKIAFHRRQWFARAIPYMLMVLVVSLASVVVYQSVNEPEDVSVDEIAKVLNDYYQPFIDSLDAGYWKYNEIASRHFVNYYNPMSEYERMIAQYPIGSAQYSTFMSTWTVVYSTKVHSIYEKIKALPFYSAAEREGRLTQEERTMMEAEIRRMQANQ